MSEPTCETCRYFDDTGQRNASGELVQLEGFVPGSVMGACHRYPPSIPFSSSVEDDVNAVMPKVWNSDWCGEHKT
jgi:hypothetical protein